MRSELKKTDLYKWTAINMEDNVKIIRSYSAERKELHGKTERWRFSTALCGPGRAEKENEGTNRQERENASQAPKASWDSCVAWVERIHGGEGKRRHFDADSKPCPLFFCACSFPSFLLLLLFCLCAIMTVMWGGWAIHLLLIRGAKTVWYLDHGGFSVCVCVCVHESQREIEKKRESVGVGSFSRGSSITGWGQRERRRIQNQLYLPSLHPFFTNTHTRMPT